MSSLPRLLTFSLIQFSAGDMTWYSLAGGVTEVEDKISHMTDLLMGNGIASEVLLERSERRNSLVI